MRLRRVGQDIAGPADWSAYHERSGRGTVTSSSRPTVPFFQLLFNYANCPAGPDPSRLASRPGAGSIVKSTRTLRGILTNRPAPYVIEIAIPLGLNCKLLYRSLQMLHDFTSRLLLHPSSTWNLEDPSRIHRGCLPRGGCNSKLTIHLVARMRQCTRGYSGSPSFPVLVYERRKFCKIMQSSITCHFGAAGNREYIGTREHKLARREIGLTV